jgi:hypothetical protein
MAPTHAVELTPINAHDPTEAKIRRIAAFATVPNGGLILTLGGTAFDRDVVIAARGARAAAGPRALCGDPL